MATSSQKIEVHDLDLIAKNAAALGDPSFPVNPLPFLISLASGVRHNASKGNWFRESDDAGRLLWILMAMRHGQLGCIDMHEEWSKLVGPNFDLVEAD